jgi:hypothetical protein
MTKAALPVRKRKASFITTNDYRITCLHVIESDDVNSDLYASMQPAVRKQLGRFDHLNIVFVGTGLIQNILFNLKQIAGTVKPGN